jgi:type IV pilus assembly protein PilV
MEILAFRRRKQRGFTLIEVLGAIFLLAFGLLALAGFLSQMNLDTNQTRYMEVAAMLASEKLEDLSRVPNVNAAMANSGGDLGSDSQATYNGQLVAYYDQVQISTDNGAATEVIVGTSNGQNGYWTVTHTAAGAASSVFATGTPTNPTSDMLVYKRRWTVEVDQPVAKLRRVTVLVTLLSPAETGTKTAQFQATMVRP